MASTFKGIGLFNSGPHRFSRKPVGEFVLSVFAATGTPAAGSLPIGPLELVIEVRGRLVAGDDAGLWALRDAVGAQLTDPPQKGTLVDHHGKSFADMSFVEFEEEDRTDRGALVSVAYTARFVRFLVT